MSALSIKAFRSLRQPFAVMCGAHVPVSINCLFLFSSSTSSVCLHDKLTPGSSKTRLKIDCSLKPSFPSILCRWYNRPSAVCYPSKTVQMYAITICSKWFELYIG